MPGSNPADFQNRPGSAGDRHRVPPQTDKLGELLQQFLVALDRDDKGFAHRHSAVLYIASGIGPV